MKKIAFFIAFFALSCQLQAQRNVIFLIADDLGTDYCGFYEDHADTVPIPNIRKLLSKGVRFKNATANPVCSATRTTALTGRYGFRTGVGNIVGGTGGSGTIDTAEITIPKLLKRYNPNIAKANIGKWHLSSSMPVSSLQAPLNLGYDHFEGPFIGALPSYTNWTKYINGVASTITTYATTENINNALAWQKLQGNRPFFIWLAFNAPHAPYHLPPTNLQTYNLSGTTGDIQQNPKKYFKASLQALDTEIGRLFDSLTVRNLMDSTDFIFIGDNGNTIQTAQIANQNKAKGTVYEYGTHVPFIIAGPSVVNPGRVSDALVNTADIFATVLELFGYSNWQTQIPANKPVDSKSLLPILKNQATTVRPWAFAENFKVMPDAQDGKAMRNAQYKLIRFDVAGNEEFYDLSADPLEDNNLLLGALNTVQYNNYIYLCNQMTTLVGTGTFCNPAVSTENNAVSTENKPFPNPFSTHIYLKNGSENTETELINTLGQVIFKGKNIEKHDFSHLPQGVYYLKIDEKLIQMIKE